MNYQAWKDKFHQLLVQQYGQTKSKPFETLIRSHAYYEEVSPELAISDINHLDQLSKQHPLQINFYYKNATELHLRTFQIDQPCALHDTLFMLENLGLRVLDKHSYSIKLADATTKWIDDFSIKTLDIDKIDIKVIEPIFKEAFINIKNKLAEDDGFNRLLLLTALNWREISVIRAYAKYLRQIRFRYSELFIQKILVNNHAIAKILVELFLLRFDSKNKNPDKAIEQTKKDLAEMMNKITTADEDFILKQYHSLIDATIRTNYFQTIDQKNKDYLSFKFQPHLIPGMPLPIPEYGIFVYSPKLEGIHLRSAKVARGGIRWSDRSEDFRTEILELMKTQVVKNSLIVPSGAKGGFVIKQSITGAPQIEGVEAYKVLINGLLDLTDNRQGDKIIHPSAVVCYDDADPYLVVAADKGTAGFSDIANAIAIERGFWLGDAFASGGATGYNHKKMGITARGAWESVKRHFLELNISLQDDFTVIGIGDMSGDVFGNGMLLSEHIKLIAAFDNRNIFLDPNPDAKISHQERLRLFNLSHSSWADYDAKLISPGGGVYSRSIKSITLSQEIQKRLNTKATTLTPDELIRAILKAPVDLFWNGGIGTYVKAAVETDEAVADRANDTIRINGNELRCKVVAEGGNLGFTQLGRIEYALHGGAINTDFIDNAGGVDCSDREVNIKILLDPLVAQHKITYDKRNTILFDMTDNVIQLILNDTAKQALAISLATLQSPQQIDLYQSYLKKQENLGNINRVLDFLPDDETLVLRKASNQGLTRPEIAVLLAHAKISLKKIILDSNIPDDPYLHKALEKAFPKLITEKFSKQLSKHRLHREIIATQVINDLVDRMGILFIHSLREETGASIADAIRAYIIARSIFGADEVWSLVGSLNHQIPLANQYEMFLHIQSVLHRAAHWFLYNRRITKNIYDSLEYFSEDIKKLTDIIPNLMIGETLTYLQTITTKMQEIGMPKKVGKRIAGFRAMYAALNIIDIAKIQHFDLTETATIYFDVGAQFNLVWLRDRLNLTIAQNYWDSLSRSVLRDELDEQQKLLTILVMKNSQATDPKKRLEAWTTKNRRALSRWRTMLTRLRATVKPDFVTFFIVINELRQLTRHVPRLTNSSKN